MKLIYIENSQVRQNDKAQEPLIFPSWNERGEVIDNSSKKKKRCVCIPSDPSIGPGVDEEQSESDLKLLEINKKIIQPPLVFPSYEEEKTNGR